MARWPTPRSFARKRAGKVILNLSEKFSTETAAERWLRESEPGLTRIGAVGRAIANRKWKKWAYGIKDCCEALPDGFGDMKSANPAYLQRQDYCVGSVQGTFDHDFVSLARDLLAGVQAPPADPDRDCPEHGTQQPRLPQTVNSLVATLRTVVKYGGPICRVETPTGDFEMVMRTLKHQEIVRKSAIRDWSPTIE